MASCSLQSLSAWGSNEAMCCEASFANGNFVDQDAEDAAYEQARLEATEWVNWLTGCQFGLHTVTIAGASGCCWCKSSECWCCFNNRLVLPFFPVCELTEIVYGGEVQDLDDFVVIDYDSSPALVPNDRCSGVDFSCCDWQVTFTYGRPVPLLGHRAVNSLACQLILSDCLPDKCRLPTGVTSVNRQGVSIQVQDVGAFMDEGLTGISAADRFIRMVNPNRLQGPAYVFHGEDGQMTPFRADYVDSHGKSLVWSELAY